MELQRASSAGIAAGEPAAFAAFYEEHSASLLRYFTRRTCDADVALDLTAETFAQAYRGRRRFRGSTDAEAAGWLYGIARRQLARFFRKGEVERRAVDRLGIEYERLSADRRTEIEAWAGVNEIVGQLGDELARLSEQQRQALQLRVVEELPYPEVAERLEITEPAARARVSRALKALAMNLDGNPYSQEA